MTALRTTEGFHFIHRLLIILAMILPRVKRPAVLMGLFLIAASALASAPVHGGPRNLVILFTHDLHSNVLPRTASGADGAKIEVGGFARLATLIRREREKAPEATLVLDAGDYSMGTLFHTLYAGESFELRLLGLMGYDAATLGNHEFDFRLGGLASSLEAARTKGLRLPALVASNIAFEGSGSVAEAGRTVFRNFPVRDYIVFERAGLKIGIFGIFGRSAADDSPFAAPAVFLDPLVEARRVVDLLRRREKVDLVVCLSHTGTEAGRKKTGDVLLAEDVPGIDVIVSGHTHTILDQPLAAGKTLIVSSGSNGSRLGRLELAGPAEGGFRVISYDLVPVGADIEEDGVVAEAAAEFTHLVETRFLARFPGGFGEILAESSFDMETPEAVEAAAADSGLGDFITDAFREAVKKAEGPAYRHVHLVLEPVGVLRDTILRGPISVEAAFRVLSLGVGDDRLPGYALLGLYLNGKELRHLLEVQASIVPMKKDALLQFSGVRLVYNPRRLPFDRVTSASILEADGSYRPIDNRKLYRVVLNAYTAGMVGYVSRASRGLLKMLPRDADGRVMAKPEDGMIDADPLAPGIQEFKEWAALSEVLKALPDTNGNGIPDIPERYRRPEGRFASEPSWNPAKLLLGGNGLTYIVLAVVVVLVLVVLFVARRIIRRRRSRRARRSVPS